MTSTTAAATLSLPVKQFSAFGNESNDCSVKFSSIKPEQVGYWTCAARRNSDEPFQSTEPAKLTIIYVDKGKFFYLLKYLEIFKFQRQFKLV